MEDTSHYRIQVAVQVRYLADQSDDAENRHVFAYTITLSKSTPLIWAWGWCAKDQAALDDNLGKMKATFKLNGQNTPIYILTAVGILLLVCAALWYFSRHSKLLAGLRPDTGPADGEESESL